MQVLGCSGTGGRETLVPLGHVLPERWVSTLYGNVRAGRALKAQKRVKLIVFKQWTQLQSESPGTPDHTGPHGATLEEAKPWAWIVSHHHLPCSRERNKLVHAEEGQTGAQGGQQHARSPSASLAPLPSLAHSQLHHSACSLRMPQNPWSWERPPRGPVTHLW